MELKFAKPADVVAKPQTVVETGQQFLTDVADLSAPKLIEPKDNPMYSRISNVVNNDEEAETAKTEAGLQIASGVVRAENAPVYEIPTYNAELYSSTIGITKYEDLRHKVGLQPDQSFTDYYRANNGYVPEGFELSAKLLLHEEKVKTLQDKYINGESSYEDFLYKAYGKDILKAQGHDFQSSLYWYGRFRNGDNEDIRNNMSIMNQVLSQAESLHQSEVWFRSSNKKTDASILRYVNNKELDAATVRSIFETDPQFKAVFEELDQVHGSTQRVIDLYRAGMLDGFQPWVDTNGDGKADFYYHLDGKLYDVVDEDSKEAATGTKAVAMYNADGSLQRIRVRNALGGFGEFVQNVAKGGYDFVAGIGSLAFLVFGGVADLGEAMFGIDTEFNRLADSTIFYEKLKNTWGWMASDYSTSNSWANSDGTFNWQGVANGLGYATGLIASMMLTGALTAAPTAAITKAGGLTTTKVVSSYADDVVRSITSLADDALKAPKTLNAFVDTVSKLPNTYLVDDLVVAANKFGIKATAEQIAQAGIKVGLQVGQRTNALIAYNAGRGILSKGIDGIKWTARTLSGIRNGAPSSNALARYGSQIATRRSLGVLAGKEFLETAGFLKSKQGSNGLDEGQILLTAGSLAVVNFGISYLLRATLDEGALDRHTKATISRINKSVNAGSDLQKIMDSGKLGSGFVRTILNMHEKHPLALARIQNAMDILENLSTMALNVAGQNMTALPDGGLDFSQFGTHMASIFNPQTLAMNAWMAYGNMNGNPLSRSNESGMKLGEIFNAQRDIDGLYNKHRQALVNESLRLETSGEIAKAKRLNKVIQEVDKTVINTKDYNTPLEAKIAALEQLDNLLITTDKNGNTKHIIREEISTNFKNEQRDRMLVNAKIQMLQYNAMVDGFEAQQKKLISGSFAEDLRKFFTENTYGIKVQEQFKKSMDIQLKGVTGDKGDIGRAKEFEANVISIGKKENALKAASPVVGELFKNTSDFIEKNVSVFVVGQKKIDPNGKFVLDPKQELDEASKKVVSDRGDDINNGTIIKINTKGLATEGTKEDKLLKQVFNAFESLSDGLIYRIGEGIYFVKDNGQLADVTTKTALINMYRTTYVLQNHPSADVKRLALVQLLQTISTDEEIRNLPQTTKELKQIINNKKNTNLLRKLEKEANKHISVSLDPNSKNVLDLADVHTSFGDDFEYQELDGALFKYSEALKNLRDYQQYRAEYVGVKNPKDKDTRQYLKKFNKAISFFADKIETDGNLLKYLSDKKLLTKDFINDLTQAVRSLGESSAPQDTKKLINEIFRSILTQSGVDISDAVTNKIIEVTANRYATQDAINTGKKTFADNLKKNIKSSSVLSNRRESLTEFVTKNDLVSLTMDEVKDLIAKSFTDLNETESKEIIKLVTNLKVKSLKDNKKGKAAAIGYADKIIRAHNDLVEKGLATEVTEVVEIKPNATSKDYSNFDKIEAETLNKSETINDYYVQSDIESLAKEAIEFNNAMYKGSTAKASNVAVVNILQLKGRYLQKFLNALNNETVINNIKNSNSESARNDIIQSIFGNEPINKVLLNIQNEIEMIREQYALAASTNGIRTFILSDEGSNEELNNLLVSFNYIKNELSREYITNNIPGVSYPNSDLAVDVVPVKNRADIDQTIIDAVKNWEKNNRIAVSKTNVEALNNLKARTSAKLEGAFGGLSYIDNDTIIDNVKDFKLNDFDIDGQEFRELTYVKTGREYESTLKQGILASLAKQVTAIVRKSLGLKGKKNPTYTKAINVLKLINATEEFLTDLADKKVSVAPERVIITPEYKAKLDALGIYNIISVPGTKDIYNITLKVDKENFRTKVNEYFTKAKKDGSIDLSLFLLAGVNDTEIKGVKSTSVGQTTTIESFVDIIKYKLGLDDEGIISFIDTLKNSTAEKDMLKYDFRNDKENLESIYKLFNGRTVKEIKNENGGEYANNIYFISFKNTIIAGTILTDKVLTELNKNYGKNAEAKELGRILPLLGTRGIREQLATVINGVLGNSKNLADQDYINLANRMNTIVQEGNYKAGPTAYRFNLSTQDETEFANAFYEAGVRNVFQEGEVFTASNMKFLVEMMDESFDLRTELDMYDVVNKENPLLELLSSNYFFNTGEQENRFLIGPAQVLNLTDEAYNLMIDTLRSNTRDVNAFNLFKNKYDALRSRAVKARKVKPDNEIIKFEKIRDIIGTSIGSEGERFVTSEGKTKEDLLKLLTDKALNKNPRYKENFKLSDIDIADVGPMGQLNRALTDAVNIESSIGTTAKASRLIPNMNYENNFVKFVNSIKQMAFNLATNIGNLKLDNDLDINSRLPIWSELANKIYLYSTGVDYSKEWTRYLLINSDGEIVTSSVTAGNGYKDVADFFKEIQKIDKDIVVDNGDYTLNGKQLYVLQLEKNMLVNNSDIGAPIKYFKFNQSNWNQMKNVSVRSILEDFDRIAKNEEFRKLDTLLTDEDKTAYKINFVITQHTTQKDIDNYLIRNLSQFFKGRKDAEKIATLFINGYENFLVNSKENNAKEEALANYFAIQKNLSEDVRNVLLNNIDKLFSYGFVYDKLTDNMKLSIDKTKETASIIKDRLEELKLIKVYDSIQKASKTYIDPERSEEDKNISIRTVKNILDENIKALNLSEDEKNSIEDEVFNMFVNSVIQKSKNPKFVIIKLLQNGFDDLRNTTKKTDPFLFSTKNVNGENDNLNNVLNKTLLAADVENIPFKQEFLKDNEGLNTVFNYAHSVIDLKDQGNTTKDKAQYFVDGFQKFIDGDGRTELNKVIKTDNRVVPVYIKVGNDYILVNKENLKTYMDEKVYNKLYQEGNGFKKAFDKYSDEMSKENLPLIIKTKSELDSVMTNYVREMFKGESYDEYKNSIILGYNSDTDIEKLEYLRNINGNFNTISGNKELWIDVLKDIINTWGFDTDEFGGRKSLEVLVNKFLTKASIGDNHDAEYDSLATAFVFAKALLHKQNTNAIKSNALDDIDTIGKTFYGDKFTEDKVKQLDLIVKLDENNLDAESKEYISNIRNNYTGDDKYLNEAEKIKKNIVDMLNYSFETSEKQVKLRATDELVDREFKFLLPKVQDFQKGDSINPAKFLQYILTKVIPSADAKDFKAKLTLMNTKDLESVINAVANMFDEYYIAGGYSENKFLDLLKRDPQQLLTLFSTIVGDDGIKINDTLLTKDTFSIEDFNNKDDENYLDVEVIGRKIYDISQTEEYKVSSENAKAKSSTNYILSNKLGPFIYDIIKSIPNTTEGLEVRSLLEDIVGTAGIYREDMGFDPEWVKNRNTRTLSLWSAYKDLFSDILDNPGSLFTVPKESFYKQATAMVYGSEVDIMDGFDSEGNVKYKTTKLQSDTIYMTYDQFANFYNFDKNITDKNLQLAQFQAVKDNLNISKNDPLYIAVTRHPNTKNNNFHVFKVELMKGDYNTTDGIKQISRTILIDKNVARNFFNGDFDGDSYGFFKPDLITQEYGKNLQSDLNFAHRIFKDIENGLGIYPLSNQSLSIYLDLQQKSYSSESPINVLQIEEDFKEIGNNINKYNALLKQRTLDVKQYILSSDFDSIQDIKNDDIKLDNLAKKLIKNNWIQTIETDVSATLPNKYIFYTENFMYKNGSGVDSKEVNENIRRRMAALQTKTLLFELRGEYDTFAGVWNKESARLVRKSVSDKLGNTLNFQRFNVDPSTKVLIEDNLQKYYDGLEKIILDGELNQKFDNEFVSGILAEVQLRKQNIQSKPELATQYADDFITFLDIINQEIYMSQRILNNYAKTIDKVKELTKDDKNIAKDKLLELFRSMVGETEFKVFETDIENIFEGHYQQANLKRMIDAVASTKEDFNFVGGKNRTATEEIINAMFAMMTESKAVSQLSNQDNTAPGFKNAVNTRILYVLDNKANVEASRLPEDAFYIVNGKENKFNTYHVRSSSLNNAEQINKLNNKLKSGNTKLEPGKDFIGNDRLVPDNEFDYYISGINKDTNQIAFVVVTKQSGSTKIGVPGSKIKGTIVQPGAINEKLLLRKEFGDIDLIQTNENFKTENLGAAASGSNIIYYDKNGKVLLPNNKAKAVYAVLETKAKNVVYEETFETESKSREIGELTFSKSQQSVDGLLFSLGNNYRYSQLESDPSKLKIEFDNEAQSKLLQGLNAIAGFSTGEMNAKLLHDVYRLVKVLENSDLSLKPELMVKEIKKYINMFAIDPANASSNILSLILQYHKTPNDFIKKLDSKNDYIGLAMFSDNISNAFIKKNRVKQVAEELAENVTKKTKAGYKQTISQISDSIGKTSLTSEGKQATLATQSNDNELEAMSVYNEEYLGYSDYINSLILQSNILRNLNGDTNTLQEITPNQINAAIQNGLLNIVPGGGASAVNGFKNQPKIYNRKIQSLNPQEGTKGTPNTSLNISLENVPQTIGVPINNFDTSFDLRSVIPTNTSAKINSDVGFEIDNSKKTIIMKDNKVKNKRETITENLTNRSKAMKNALVAASGSFKNVNERVLALGIPDPNIVINLATKRITGTPARSAELTMVPSHKKTTLSKAKESIIKDTSSDLFYTTRENIKKNNAFELGKTFIQKTKDKVLNKELPEAIIVPESVTRSELNDKQREALNLLNTFTSEELQQIGTIKKPNSTAEDDLKNYGFEFKKDKELNGASELIKETGIKEDVLESGRISTKTETGFLANDALVQSRKNKTNFAMDIARVLFDIYDEAKALNAQGRINHYMFIKHKLEQVKDLRERVITFSKSSDTKLIAQKDKYEESISSILKSIGGSEEEAQKYLDITEKYYSGLTKKANAYVQYVYETQKDFIKYTDNPISNIYLLVVPNIPLGSELNSYKHYKFNMFRSSMDPAELTALNLGNYNFFENMLNIGKMVAVEKAAFELGRSLRSNGIMENQTIVEKSEELVEKYLLEQMSNAEVNTKFDELLDEDVKIFNDTVIKHMNGDASSFMLGGDGKDYSMKNKTYGQYYVGMYNKLTNYIKYKGVSYSEAKTNLTSQDPFVVEEAKRIINAYNFKEDVLVNLFKKTKVDASAIYDNLKNYAASNNLALTDKFGRLIPEKIEDMKIINNLNFEYALKGLQYFSPYNGGYKNQVVLDMLAGDVFFTNKQVAEALDKYEYNRKPPSSFQRQLSKVTGLMTTLIMSNPFQLLSRAAKWTAGDLGWGVMTDWRTLTKQAEAFKDIRSWISSNGAAVSDNMKEFMYLYGVDPTKMNFNLINNNVEDAESTGRLFKTSYFDKTAKLGNYQSMFERYAIFLGVKQGFDDNKPSYGSVLSKQDYIDRLTDQTDSNGNLKASANSRKAFFIMAQTLGAGGDFPDLAKNLNGYFMFTTYPLAMLRWARNEISSMGTAMNNIFIESHPEKMQSSLRYLMVKGLGAAGLYGAIYLINSLVASIYDVDEETKEEWIDEQATPELLKTLLQGSPVIDKYNSVNPIRQITEKTLVPFFEAYEESDGNIGKTIIGGLGKFALENFGNINPIAKNSIELVIGGDIIEREIIPFNEQQDIYDNFYRKALGYLIGASGSRAAINYLSDIAPYEEDKPLGMKILTGLTKAVSAEFGNLKSYKGDVKNYYKANSMIQEYRFSEENTVELTQEERLLRNNEQFNSDQYSKLRSDINQLKFENAPLTKVYAKILEAREDGMSLSSIRSAVRNSSVEYKLDQIDDKESFYATLDPKDIASIQKALLFEQQYFSWLQDYDELLTNLIQRDNSTSNSNRRYTPNIYIKDAYRPYLTQSYRQPYLNNYWRKPYLRSPFSAYRSSWFELNPEFKSPPKEE